MSLELINTLGTVTTVVIVAAAALYRDYEIARGRGLVSPEVSQEYVELRRAALLVGNAYEELGVLVKNGIIDKSLFLDRYAWRILSDWNCLKN